ncbi:DUF6221 family protein [Streptomyces sp. NBC_00233]|uniref:DUF6221 family protein n=1 Tax=Streptomyces sp. NBC_00233 TaxID=2975686 RepID=UPI00338FEE86
MGSLPHRVGRLSGGSVEDLIAFLRARLAEDAHVARQACAHTEATWRLDEESGDTIGSCTLRWMGAVREADGMALGAGRRGGPVRGTARDLGMGASRLDAALRGPSRFPEHVAAVAQAASPWSVCTASVHAATSTW